MGQLVLVPGQYPEPHDVGRLFQHLGLRGYDPEYRPHALELATRPDHPGIAFYKLHSIKMEHAFSRDTSDTFAAFRRGTHD